MIDHLIAKDFKDCTKMVKYTDLLYSRRRTKTIAAVNTNYEAAINVVSGGRHREFSPQLSEPPRVQPPEDPLPV
jgi:hypothetical protein